MVASTTTARTCTNGHSYVKTSDCPVCPSCEKEQKPATGLLAELAAPARRALANKGISTVEQLSTFSQKEILQLHGIGKSTLPKLQQALAARQLTFKISN
ncbi:helix-hairpin-helix domain-containing protein [Adhaeribacter rhizoryzae]|uniref:RNA polymerase alpha subunit C-terminal domain-containing protein n=1 Tax=Adhaeribacter rhizoryzae TaxID=2607907 RepID=A0A5M6DGY1_9BACT|nr:hypothetical protein [Adhaeribacter rhizoryzae]KAA5546781.1 hypothetical protein F0145_10630 [Adhaeribacter rhizoryzae]